MKKKKMEKELRRLSEVEEYLIKQKSRIHWLEKKDLNIDISSNACKVGRSFVKNIRYFL